MKSRKIVGIVSFVFASVLLLMVILPLFFTKPVTESTKELLNKSINGKLDFGKVGLSFFRHFPNLTLTINDFSLLGSAPFSADTLAYGREISLGINLFSLFGNCVKINSIYLNESGFNILMGEEGSVNYDIFAKGQQEVTESSPGQGSASLEIDAIRISKSKFRIYDSTSGLLIEVGGFDYKGKGDSYGDVFNLKSAFSTDNLNFSYAGVRYLDKKTAEASMETAINTSTLNFKLLKNRVRLEDVNALFSGDLTILDDGYDIDFNLKTDKSGFRDLFSLIPHEYTDWFAKTRISGSTILAVNLKGSSRDSLNTNPNLDINIEVANGKISHENAPYPLEKIFLKCSVVMPGLNPDLLELRLDTLSFTLQGRKNHAKVSYKGMNAPTMVADLKGSLDLKVLTESIGLESFKLGGFMDYKASVDGVLNLSERCLPVIDAAVRITGGTVSSVKYPGSIKNLDANISISTPSGKYSDLSVIVDPFAFVFDEKPFSITAKLKDFDNLRYDVVSKGDLNLDNMCRLLSIKEATIKGELLSDLKLIGSQSDAKSGKYQKLDNSGRLELKNFEFKSKNYKYPFRIPGAVLTFSKEKALLGNTTLEYNNNSILLEGYMQNFIGYYFEGGDLTGRFSLRSEQIALDDFAGMYEGDTTISNASQAGVIQIPGNLKLSLSAYVRNIVYDKVKAKNFSGAVSVKDGALVIKNTRINMAGAKFSLEAGYKPINMDMANFSFNVKADSFDIRRAYREIPIFRELVSSAANVKGVVSTEYSIAGKLNQNMEPIYPSLKGKGYIRLDDVKVKGLRILGAVSKATGRDSLNDPHLKSVLIKTTIANNIVRIERTKMKIFGFRPRFEGETSLDGRLNLKFRLGLPPFGIIGIPMTITGTFENPKVNMRRSKEGDKLEEDIDESESPILNNPPVN